MDQAGDGVVVLVPVVDDDAPSMSGRTNAAKVWSSTGRQEEGELNVTAN